MIAPLTLTNASALLWLVVAIFGSLFVLYAVGSLLSSFFSALTTLTKALTLFYKKHLFLFVFFQILIILSSALYIFLYAPYLRTPYTPSLFKYTLLILPISTIALIATITNILLLIINLINKLPLILKSIFYISIIIALFTSFIPSLFSSLTIYSKKINSIIMIPLSNYNLGGAFKKELIKRRVKGVEFR